jgi:hypothetical protein
VDKKEYTPVEAALAVLKHVESLSKSSPENQTTGQMMDLKIPNEPKAPKANEKVISQPKELKLKKFMQKRLEKKMAKGNK